VSSVSFTASGKTVWIDAEDLAWVALHKWRLNEDGYVTRHAGSSAKRTTARLARELVSAKPGQFVDHIDGDPLNNRKSNLRICTHQQNLRNRKKFKGSLSKYKGVGRFTYSRKNPWKAVFNKKYIGCFPTEEAAARAWDEAAFKEFGEFARLNFPREAA